MSSFLLLLIMGQTFSVPRRKNVDAAEEISEGVAEIEMNAHQEAPLSHDPETGNSNVDAASQIASAQSRLQGLQHLPTELLQGIASSLPPSSIISLTRTCRRIHHHMNVSFEQLLGGVPARRPSARGHLINTSREQRLAPESYCRSFLDEYYRSWVHGIMLGRWWRFENPVVEPSVLHSERWRFERPAMEEPRVLHSERLIFLCMLERDGQINPSRAVCSSCVATHDISFFAPHSLDHQSDKRECLGRAGRMWICPHWQCGYDEVRSSSTDHWPSHVCGATGLIDRKPFVASICGMPIVGWPLMRFHRDQAPPSRSQVADALRPLTVSACPHFKMNDPFVLHHYSPDCQKLRYTFPRSLRVPCICKACLRLEPNCPECGADVFFDVTEDYTVGNYTLEVFVQRRGGGFNGVSDPGWIKQLAFPADFERLDQAWNESASRLGPRKG